MTAVDPLDPLVERALAAGWSLVPQVGHGACDNALVRNCGEWVTDLVTIPLLGASTVVRLQGGPEPGQPRRTGVEWWRHHVSPEVALDWLLHRSRRQQTADRVAGPGVAVTPSSVCDWLKSSYDGKWHAFPREEEVTDQTRRFLSALCEHCVPVDLVEHTAPTNALAICADCLRRYPSRLSNGGTDWGMSV